MSDQITIYREKLLAALNSLQVAIEFLDSCEAPLEIAAHVDLATHQLQREIADLVPSAAE